jgi:predicted GNAT family acetyltransferase
MHTIQLSDHHFFIGESQNPQAWLEFTLHDAVLTLVHTEVTPVLQGQGVAGQLVAFAVDYARRNALKVIPLCTYAAGQFEKKAEYRDVLLNP